MSSIAGVVQPTKFLLIIIQIVLLSVILETKVLFFVLINQNNFIYQGISISLGSDSSEYQQANQQYLNLEIKPFSLTGITIVFLICVLLEFFIMFSGVTLFHDRMNLVQILFHVMSIIATSVFITGKGHYYQLWKIWIVGGYIKFFLNDVIGLSL